jgi:hypothetical protein
MSKSNNDQKHENQDENQDATPIKVTMQEALYMFDIASEAFFNIHILTDMIRKGKSEEECMDAINNHKTRSKVTFEWGNEVKPF